jgi:hypothetical protein
MTEPYALNLKGHIPRLSDSDRFVIWTLWVIGFSASSIAAVTGLPRKRVLNACNHSPYAGRSLMSDAQRKEFLQELKEIRCENGVAIDDGRLDKVRWEIMPLIGRKRRPGRVA